MRVLVVEDEAVLADDMAVGLEAAGFSTQICRDGEEAWFLGDTELLDAVILDLGLPKLDGLTVLRRWRSAGRTVPVIVLTARNDWTEKVEGINSGADDYLTKPIKIEELVARLRAVLRRTHGHAGPILKSGVITLDTERMRLSVNDEFVALTQLEYRLMAYMIHHSGEVLSSAVLRDHVYGDDESREINAIEALIGRLRRKLKVKCIETRRGLGYCLKDDSP